jgi:hypothetical protein
VSARFLFSLFANSAVLGCRLEVMAYDVAMNVLSPVRDTSRGIVADVRPDFQEDRGIRQSHFDLPR